MLQAFKCRADLCGRFLPPTSSSPSNDSCSWAATSTLIAWPFRRTQSAWTAHESTSRVRLPPGVKSDATRLTDGFSILPADRVLRRRHAEHQASLKSLNQNVSMEDDDPGFWISKRWWRRFFEAVPPGALTDFVVPVPSSDEFQSGASSFWSGSWATLAQTGGFFLNIDVVCVHGGLQPTGSRRMITEEVRPSPLPSLAKRRRTNRDAPSCRITGVRLPQDPLRQVWTV